MGANRLLVARAAASFILAISSGVAAQEPGDDWAISDTSDNVRGDASRRGAYAGNRRRQSWPAFVTSRMW